MKRKVTAILAMFLCAILTVTGICTDTAYAAENTQIKVTYKKKSVTFTVDADRNGVKEVKLKTLKNKWGKPATTKNEYTETYVWEKGKSRIGYTIDLHQPQFSNFSISTQDKNLSVCGIKVGMKKSKVKKILKTLGDVNEQKASGGLANCLSVELVDQQRVYINCGFENGKVSDISCSLFLREK